MDLIVLIATWHLTVCGFIGSSQVDQIDAPTVAGCYLNTPTLIDSPTSGFLDLVVPTFFCDPVQSACSLKISNRTGINFKDLQ